MRVDLDAVCRDKSCHPNRQAARDEANRLRAQSGERFSVYPCVLIFGKWHTGHVGQFELRRPYWRKRRNTTPEKRPKMAPAERFTTADRARIERDNVRQAA